MKPQSLRPRRRRVLFATLLLPPWTPAGRGGSYIGPPYLGMFCPNVLNTTRLVPLNPRAHSDDSCRQATRPAPPPPPPRKHAGSVPQLRVSACLPHTIP